MLLSLMLFLWRYSIFFGYQQVLTFFLGPPSLNRSNDFYKFQQSSLFTFFDIFSLILQSANAGDIKLKLEGFNRKNKRAINIDIVLSVD